MTTLSTSADQALMERVDRLVELEDRTRSQVVHQAVDFWSHLPPEAHTAYRQVRTLSPQTVEKLYRRIAREMLDAQFDVARARVVEGMRVPAAVDRELGPDAEDSAFETAAVSILNAHTHQHPESVRRFEPRARPRGQR